ncbi:MAG: hypothetical protein RLZZ66_1555 [Pseudomonadota bacterium]|jgi:hypothetical protein
MNKIQSRKRKRAESIYVKLNTVKAYRVFWIDLGFMDEKF